MTEQGIRANVHAENLSNGNAYTTWMVYFDHPSDCSAKPCVPADATGDAPAGVVTRIDGLVADGGPETFGGMYRNLRRHTGARSTFRSSPTALPTRRTTESLPGFEQVVAAWLQALASLAIAPKGSGRRAYLSAVADLLQATEEALSILAVGWTRVLSPDCSPGGACLPRRTAPPLAATYPVEQLTPREREVAALVARA